MGWIADLLKEIPSAARYKAELEEMERENAQLKQKVVSLESENEYLRQEIQRRDDIIQQEKSHGTLLDSIEEEILLFLHGRRRTIEDVKREQKISPAVAEMHLKDLFSKDMVTTRPSSDRKLYWHIKELGTRYLIEHKRITQQGAPLDRQNPGGQ